ncbi:hypothetical protein C8Q75DRAFT_733551 [Abortiporus biennis]|nr:hypothetical protein C8Q75DRAFT_733551 [Abortiporus biennis]
MATVTHYIYSHYDPPKEQDKQQEETILASESTQESVAVLDLDQAWEKESAFSAQRQLAAAPRFVPAVLSYDEINNIIGSPHQPPTNEKKVQGKGGHVAGWYRSLARSNPNISPASAPATVMSTPIASGSQTPVEVDGSQALKLPVFLAIGLSNRGFTMLERSGWTEGEALGPHVIRQKKRRVSRKGTEVETALGNFQETITKVEEEEMEINYDPDGEVTEVRKVEVVDLTLSDSEDEVDSSEDDNSGAVDEVVTSPAGIALLTPIQTVLKSDRLGIGLKAKTVGPYKESKKRVTHNQAALAAHTRAAEEMRRMKRLHGRGTKAFARAAKAEAEKRRQLIASLNQG